jgi:hypothetical protein
MKKTKSLVDSIIIDLILEHYNIQSFTGKKEVLTGDEFDKICNTAKKIYFEKVMITEKPGVA